MKGSSPVVAAGAYRIARLGFAAADYTFKPEDTFVGSFSNINLFLYHLELLSEENKALKKRIREIESDNSSTVIVETRAVSKREAEKLIEKHFDKHRGQKLYASDISEELCIDYLLVTEIIDDLEGKGQVKKC